MFVADRIDNAPSLPLYTYKARAGDDPGYALSLCLEVVRTVEGPIRFSCGGAAIVVSPGDLVRDALARYYEALDAARRAR